MAIRILSDSIKIGSYTLKEIPTVGIVFDGKVTPYNTIDRTQAQGTDYGFTAYGQTPPSPPFIDVGVQRFPFASNANAVNTTSIVASTGRYMAAGQSSSTYGYTSGGTRSGVTITSIYKFPFAVTSGTTTYVGNLGYSRYGAAGHSSTTHGYSSGGTPLYNLVDKFPFASDATAVFSQYLTQITYSNYGNSSSTHAYSAGGYAPGGLSNVIDKFPFASNANATDVGDLTTTRVKGVGISSNISGYMSGGSIPPTQPAVNIIDKFPFASDANATDVGDLTVARPHGSGQSSTVSGYTSGGFIFNTIDKFPFASNANATDVGDLTANVVQPTGHQY